MAIITVLSEKRRSGTFESTAWHVPSNATGIVKLWLKPSLADLQDTSNNITLDYYVSLNGTIWEHRQGKTWEGGNYTDKLGNILQGIDIVETLDDVAGKYVKMIATLNQQMTISVTIETI